MNPEHEEGRQHFMKVLKDHLEKSLGIEVEIGMNDTLYRTLTFKVGAENRNLLYNQISIREFVDLLRPIGIEVVELYSGEGVDRLVVQMREGAILDRINFANTLQKRANNLDVPFRIFCEGPEFNRLIILAPNAEVADNFMVLTPTRSLRGKLADLDFEGCKIQDPKSIRQLIIKGKPLINF